MLAFLILLSICIGFCSALTPKTKDVCFLVIVIVAVLVMVGVLGAGRPLNLGGTFFIPLG